MQSFRNPVSFHCFSTTSWGVVNIFWVKLGLSRVLVVDSGDGKEIEEGAGALPKRLSQREHTSLWLISHWQVLDLTAKKAEKHGLTAQLGAHLQFY